MTSVFQRKGAVAQSHQPTESVQAATAPAAAAKEVKLTPIQKAQIKVKEMRESGEFVIERLNPREKALKYPRSLRAAITAHCWDCQGAGADPGVKQAVRDCKITQCNLHHLRPWQTVSGKNPDAMTEEELEQQRLIDSQEPIDDETEVDIEEQEDAPEVVE